MPPLRAGRWARVARPVLFAHRGASGELPENTLPAFRRALEVGATALETDAHLTRDGHVVLCHDPSVSRTAGVARLVREASLKEVRAWDVGAVFYGARKVRTHEPFTMPTLDELLVDLPGMPLNVDIKRHDAWAARAVVDVVRRRRAQDRVRLASFDTATLRHVRRLGYEGSTSLGATEVGRLVLSPEAMLRTRRLGGDAAQIPVAAWGLRLDSARFIAKVHGLGLLVHYWTIDTPAEAQRLIDLGADGVMTNEPARLAHLFATP